MRVVIESFLTHPYCFGPLDDNMTHGGAEEAAVYSTPVDAWPGPQLFSTPSPPLARIYE